jgi:hypothetical protein
MEYWPDPTEGGFCVFSKSLQYKPCVRLRLGHDHFVPNIFHHSPVKLSLAPCSLRYQQRYKINCAEVKGESFLLCHWHFPKILTLILLIKALTSCKTKPLYCRSFLKHGLDLKCRNKYTKCHTVTGCACITVFHTA